MCRALRWTACLAAVLCAGVAPARARGGAAACEGMFAAAGAFPLDAGVTSPVAVVRLDAGRIELAGICPLRRAQLSRVRRGWRVRVRWRRCGTYRGVTVRGRLDAQCSAFEATVRTRRPAMRLRLSGLPVRCGDGRVDAAGGEDCEPPGGPRCDGQCRGIPSTCGNGRVYPPEECDDGNAADDDACSLSCHANLACNQVTFASTWAAVQSVVFARRGCSEAACHGSATPSGGLDLRPGYAHGALVGVPSVRDPSLLRIAVGDPARSLLVLKVAPGLDTARYGSPMPLQLPPLSPDEVEALKLWIRAGAPETGVVADTAGKLRTCLPGATPTKIEPLPPPPAGEGVQLYAPPWSIPPRGEDEVCFATTYDFSDRVPASRRLPCPSNWGGASRECFAYAGSQFRQDPNSHHSIVYAYTGSAPHDAFGPFTCHGGVHADQPCDPTRPGVAPPAGADCGQRSACAGRIARLAPACYPAAGGSYGPYDFSTGGGVSNTPTTHGIGGAQTPVASTSHPPGVYAVLPVRGVIVWNSHAFNLTGDPTTNEQWLNLEFGSGPLQHLVLGVFDASGIFDTRVPPFAQQELCRSSTFERGARIIELSSHTHKRGVRFRVWGPPVEPCVGDCAPDARPPEFTTTDYADPARVRYDPPLALDSTAVRDRTFKFCALYDNGFANPATVKRKSRAPLLSLGFCNGIAHYALDCCAELRCIGPQAGMLCSSDAECGGGAGSCDACTLYGGVTTEDEMFILTGGYYQVPVR